MITIRASALHRYFLCPSALLHEQGFVEQKQSKYAEEGTRKHLEMQESFENPESFDKNEHAKRLVRLLEDTFDLNFKPYDLIIEQRHGIGFDNFILTGTPDFVYFGDFRGFVLTVFIVDYKFGYQKILARNNVQLLAYAFLVYNSFKSFEKTNGRASSISLKFITAIYQDESLDFCEVTFDDLEVFKDRLFEVFKQSQKHTYNPSENACEWCRHRPDCVALKEEVEKTQQLILQNADKFNLSDDEKFEYRKNIILKRKLLEYAIEDAEDFFKDKLLNGASFDFVSLKSNGSMKSWSKDFTEKEIIDEILKSNNLKSSDIVDTKLKTVSQINKLAVEIPEKFIEVREKAKSLKVKEKEVYGEKIVDDLF